MVNEQNILDFSERCKAIFEQIERDMIGQHEAVEGTVIAMIAGGNVLLEGVPGVGKTTLAKVIMGLVTPTAGTILWNGQDITGMSITERARLGISYGQYKAAQFANQLEAMKREAAIFAARRKRKEARDAAKLEDQPMPEQRAGAAVPSL